MYLLVLVLIFTMQCMLYNRKHAHIKKQYENCTRNINNYVGVERDVDTPTNRVRYYESVCHFIVCRFILFIYFYALYLHVCISFLKTIGKVTMHLKQVYKIGDKNVVSSEVLRRTCTYSFLVELVSPLDTGFQVQPVYLKVCNISIIIHM